MKKSRWILPLVILCAVAVIAVAFAAVLQTEEDGNIPEGGDGDTELINVEVPLIPYEWELSFESEYVRTGWGEGEKKYPFAEIIASEGELVSYLGSREEYAAYSEKFFEDNSLIVVTVEEGSGSIRHNVGSVKRLGDKTAIEIERIVPEVGTCDMAAWNILISMKKTDVPESKEDIQIYIDRVNSEDITETVDNGKLYASIRFSLPRDWRYEYVSEDGAEFSVYIWHEDEKEGKIRFRFCGDLCGVCGTGLTQEDVEVAGYEAWKGTYDNSKAWDFISFKDTPGSYMILNEGADGMIKKYEEDIDKIFSSLRLGDGNILRTEAIEIAKEKVTVEYDNVNAVFNTREGMWKVSFYKGSTPGGDQAITMTNEGKIIDITYGE